MESRSHAIAAGLFAIVLSAGVVLALWWGLPSGLWLVVPFVVLAVRAFVVGRKPLRPGTLGIIELVCFVLTVVCAVLAHV